MEQCGSASNENYSTKRLQLYCVVEFESQIRMQVISYGHVEKIHTNIKLFSSSQKVNRRFMVVDSLMGAIELGERQSSINIHDSVI